MSTQSDPIRVFFQCTGVGIFNRGIESFFREAYDGLKGTRGVEGHLIKGAGTPLPDEHVAWCLPRTGKIAPIIGRVTGRSAYAAEQWSSFPAVVRQIRRLRPHLIYYSDSNLGFLLKRWRCAIGVPYRLLFSNGGPCRPPFDRHDFVQQVAPYYLDEALAAGEPVQKHFMVPYGIHLPAAPVSDADGKQALRERLGLPLNRKIILSVGWIAREHKRMDYVIEEVARLPEPRPYLQLLGAMDERSEELVELGRNLLGPENFDVRSVPYEEVGDYYRAADVFVLGSLKEGFGRVYLEALMHGLPTIGHRHPVMEYVLGDVGVVGDLTQGGALASLMMAELAKCDHEGMALRRWESVRQRFGWEMLRDDYATMLRDAVSRPIGV